MKAWVVKDMYGTLCLYLRWKPYKEYGFWKNCNDNYIVITDADIPEGINPQWSDNEPIEVELKIEMVK